MTLSRRNVVTGTFVALFAATGIGFQRRLRAHVAVNDPQTIVATVTDIDIVGGDDPVAHATVRVENTRSVPVELLRVHTGIYVEGESVTSGLADATPTVDAGATEEVSVSMIAAPGYDEYGDALPDGPFAVSGEVGGRIVNEPVTYPVDGSEVSR